MTEKLTAGLCCVVLLTDYPRENNAQLLKPEVFKDTDYIKTLADSSSKFKEICQAEYRWISWPSFVKKEKRKTDQIQTCSFGE